MLRACAKITNKMTKFWTKPHVYSGCQPAATDVITCVSRVSELLGDRIRCSTVKKKFRIGGYDAVPPISLSFCLAARATTSRLKSSNNG